MAHRAIYITKNKANRMDEAIRREGALIESKRDPTVLHKYLGIAFADHTLHVVFENGRPVSCRHAGSNLGICRLRKTQPTDVSSKGGKFDDFCKTHSSFVLRLSHVCDGFIEGGCR